MTMAVTYFVDVNAERLLPALLVFLLVSGADGLLCLSGFLNGFTTWLGRHCFGRFGSVATDY